MPDGTCDPATRGQAYNQLALEVPAPNGSGSVLIDGKWDWNGTSVRPNCDGPIFSLRLRSTCNMTAWALLPLKKRGSTWIKVDAGTDVDTTSKGQLSNLGLSNYSDIREVGFTFIEPV